ncbi:MAG: acyl-CoA dehydrogenase family protein, partial [Pseudomonadota bacterium]
RICGNAYAPGLKNALAKTKKLASVEQSGGEPLMKDPDFQRKVADMEMRIEALNATELRIFSALSAGDAVGPESSMLKCAGSEAQQAISELSLEAVGGYAAPFVQDTFAVARAGANAELPTPDYAASVAPSYFNYRKTSIYAGSNEIQRNIMSKMVLGL